MSQKIKVKRSNTAIPSAVNLSAGEIGYSAIGGSNRVFIGDYNGTGVVEIAGDKKMNIVAPATNGDLATLNASGQVIDSGVQISTDGTFSANSNTLLSTQAATKSYISSTLSNINTIKTIALSSHGFVVGNVIAISSTGAYILANAISSTTSNVVGIVSSVIDANNFVLLEDGYVTSLSGLVSGTIYYLSQTTAGALTTSIPTNAIKLLTADSATTGYFNISSVSSNSVSSSTPLISSVINDYTVNPASLAAGYYIFDVTPNAGLPSGITNLYDIVSYNGSTWSTFLTYANAGTTVRVGSSEANVTLWQKTPSGGWLTVNYYPNINFSVSNDLMINFNMSNILDATGIVITANNTNVAKWQNTGNILNGHLAQTSAGARPIYNANAFGSGIGAVQFSANDGTWLGSNFAIEQYQGSFTMLFFIKFLTTNTTLQTNNNSCFFYTGNDGGVEHNAIASLKGNSNFQSIVASINSFVRNYALPVNVPIILTVRTVINYGANNNNVHYIELMLNGKSLGFYKNTAQSSFLGLSNFLGLNAIYPGANTAASASANLGFQIRDIRIYAGTKSDADLEAIYHSIWSDAGMIAPSVNYASSSLIMKWDASNAGSITQSGGKVSQWNDLIGGATATQPTSANQPAYVANAFGTLPGIGFTAASAQFLSGTNGIPFTVNATIFAVVKFPVVNGGVGAIYGTSSNGNIFAQSGQNLIIFLGTNSSQNLSYALNTSYVVCAINGIGILADTTAFTYGVVFTNASDTGTTSMTKNFFIGRNGATANYTDCVLGELQIYQGSLGYNDVKIISQSLATKWGVTLI